MEASADHGHQKSQDAAGACHGSDSNNGKSRADFYTGAVAQRALYGPSPSRCHGGPRRVAGKDSKPPSRLSKMSGAEGT